MPTETIERTNEAHPARRLALDPYVTRVRSWCLENERTGCLRSISLRLGYQALTFEPPEFAMILRSARGDGEAATDALPLEILGLLTKSHEDLANLRSLKDPTSRSVFALQAELMLDAALGAALLAELEPRIDELALDDDDRSAGALSQLRELLRAAASEVSSTISESERDRAGDLAISLTDRPPGRSRAEAIATPPPRSAVRRGPASSKKTDDARPTPARPAVSRRPEFSLTALLGVGLALASGVWLGLFVLPGLRAPAIERLTLSAFADSAVLSEVEARPPSLFVQVDRERWRSLDEAGRLAVVEEVAGVLSREGYSGALFETGDGRPVAQWLRDRGARLIGDPLPGGTVDRPSATD